jgi:hypothetical protein
MVMTVSSDSQRVFDLRSGTRVAALRICGAIDLALGILFSIAAIGLWIGSLGAAAGPGDVSEIVLWATLATVAGLVVTWAGLLMMFNRVVVTQMHLTSGQSLRVRRRVLRESITAIDIRQKNFGKMSQSVPVAALRDGADLCLMPISVLISRPGESNQLARQHAVVTELRQALGVGGTDLNEADVRWPRGN